MTLLLSTGAVVWSQEGNSEPDNHSSQSEVEEGSRGRRLPRLHNESLCAPLANGIAEGRQRNGLLAIGMATDRIPASLFKRFRIGNWLCLADNVQGHVEAVALTITDQPGTEVATLLFVPEGEDNYQHWHDYLESLYEGKPLEFVDRKDLVIAIAAGSAAEEVREAVADGSTVSAWDTLLRETRHARP